MKLEVKEMINEIVNPGLKKRNDVVDLLNNSFFDPNPEEISDITGKGKDEVESAMIEYQDVEKLINAKRYNSEYDYQELLEKKKRIVDKLLGEGEKTK